jgi:hypothetical protein
MKSNRNEKKYTAIVGRRSPTTSLSEFYSTHGSHVSEHVTRPTKSEPLVEYNFVSTVAKDINSISIKNLELAQLKSLIHESVVLASASSLDRGVIQMTPAEISSQVVRVCLYYETALNLAHSIVDITSRLVSRMTSSFEDGGTGSNMIQPSSHQSTGEFFGRNEELITNLRLERNKIFHDTLSAIHSLDPGDPGKSKLRLFLLAKYREERVLAICAMTQSLLQLVNSLIEAGSRFADSRPSNQ